MQEVSNAYTPFLDTDELKMTQWARKVSGAYKKPATETYPYHHHPPTPPFSTLLTHSCP